MSGRYRKITVMVAAFVAATSLMLAPGGADKPPRPPGKPTTTTSLSTSTTTTVPATTTSTTPPAGTVYTIPGTIASNCSSDVTSALNTWIRSVPDGTASTPNVLRFGAGACYRVDGTLINPRGQITPERKHLTFDGNGSTLDGRNFSLPSPTATKINHSMWMIIHGQGLTVQNFTMVGQHPNPCNVDTAGNCRDGGAVSAYEWYAGVAFEGGRDLVVRGNTIQNMYGDGIGVSQGPNCYQGQTVWGADHPINVRIENNLIDGTGRHGIGLTAGDGITMVGNTFDRISYHTADLEYECYQPVKNITFDRNIIKRHYLAFIASITGGESGVCPPVGFNGPYVITNNVMERSGVTTTMPIWIASTQPLICPNDKRDMHIRGNTLLYAHAEGSNSAIQIDTTSGVISILDNRIIQPGSAAAVKFTRVASAAKTVSNNDMRESSWVYWLDGSPHSAGVTSCGNTTLQGANQPRAC
jgi:hypothetical protein